MAKDGQYYPALVQIDNEEGGTGVYAPWYASYADVIYETPLRSNGATRMVMLFNDILPEYCGPCRSLRAHHIALQAEWGCVYVFHGRQEKYVDALIDKIAKINPDLLYANGYIGLLYSGADNEYRPYLKNGLHFRVASPMISPHNSCFRLADIMTTVAPRDHAPLNHTYKFTDELPEGGDDAGFIYVTWEKKSHNNSRLEYDPEENVYYRYLTPEANKSILYQETAPEFVRKKKVTDNNGNEQTRYQFDLNPGKAITFSNVIVQYVEMKWTDGGVATPSTPLGTGNADFFMGGQHYQGVWKRDSLGDRTVFYGTDGNEMPILRGKTLIIQMDYKSANHSVSYDP